MLKFINLISFFVLLLPVKFALAEPIPGHYIVKVQHGHSPSGVAKGHAIHADHIMTKAINGFSAALNSGQLNALRHDPNVVEVVQDQVIRAFDIQYSPPSWGLDRIDQQYLPLDNMYVFNYTGSGVTAYIIDTGINYSHQEFGGRAVFGYDALGGDGSDCNGHGTHVSGTVGGATTGVAKAVTLVAVRVLDCNGSGSESGVIAGIDWIINNHTSLAVANMSLGGAADATLDSAVNNLISSGVPTAVAAGNSNADACDTSPARVASAMTVGATDQTDTRASFSNYGACVAWFAPGVDIYSSYYSANDAYALYSGTSMAAPHTAGAAALYLQANPGASPDTVWNALYNLTTKNVVANSNSANNHILYTPQ